MTQVGRNLRIEGRLAIVELRSLLVADARIELARRRRLIRRFHIWLSATFAPANLLWFLMACSMPGLGATQTLLRCLSQRCVHSIFLTAFK